MRFSQASQLVNKARGMFPENQIAFIQLGFSPGPRSCSRILLTLNWVVLPSRHVSPSLFPTGKFAATRRVDEA